MSLKRAYIDAMDELTQRAGGTKLRFLMKRRWGYVKSD